MAAATIQTLKKVAVYGAFLSLFGSVYCYHRIQKSLASGSYYQKSLNLLKEKKQLVEIIGPPIRTTYLDLGNRSNTVTHERAELYIPLRGSNRSAKLHTICHREAGKDWEIEKLTLESQGHSFLISEKNEHSE